MCPSPSAPRRLTARQQRFCEFIVAGETQTDAWLLAGYKVSRKVARRNAAKSLKNPRIAARVAELRATETGASLASRDWKRRKLYAIMTNPESRPADIIRAIELDCRIAGHFGPEKLEVDDGPSRLASMEERAKQVVASLSRFARMRGEANGANGNGSYPSAGLSRWQR